MPGKLPQVALRTTLLYAIVAAIWILVSDRLLVALVSDPVVIGNIAIYKGWAFVVVTAVLLYVTLRSQLLRWELEAAERKLAEEKLRESENTLSTIIDSAMDAVITVDEDQRITLFNSSAEKIFLYTAKEVLGQPVEKLIPERFHSVHRKHIQNFADDSRSKRKMTEPGSVYGLRKDGVEIPLETSISKAQIGGRKFFTLIHHDITQRIQAEKAIREQFELQDQLAKITATAPGLIYSYRLRPDGSACLPFASDAIREIYGLRHEDVIDDASPIFKMMNADDAKQVSKSIAESARNLSVWHDEFRIEHPEKGEIWLEGYSMPAKEPDGSILWHGFVHDITHRKRTEESLRERNQLIASIANTTPNWMYLYDRTKHQNIYSNNRLSQILGYTIEEVRAMGDNFIYKLLHPEDIESADLYDKRISNARYGEVFEIEYRLRHKNGEWIWMLGCDTVFSYMEDGVTVQEVLGTASDITERKRAEKENLERERLIFAINNAAPSLIILWDVKAGTILYVNDSILNVLGYKPEEIYLMSNQEIYSLIHPDDLSAIQSFTDTLLKAKDGEVLTHEYRCKNNIGEWRVLSSQDTIFKRNAKGSVIKVLSVVDDITERVNLEDQLRQSQKLEGIGQLAGGVAHDFNNLLTVITGCSEMLLSVINDNDPNKQYVSYIQKAGERAASLTRQLLAFSRKQLLEPKVLNLNTVIGNTEKMLRRLIGEDIIITTVLNPTVKQIKADPGQIEQVIINLAVNARDAMPQGGRLILETSDAVLDDEYCKQHPGCNPGNYILLSITDNGCGMSAETQSHIFEPFFTTKEVGKGTGLGLATVFGIVKQSGGHIAVESKVDVGTTFLIYLPAIEESDIISESALNSKTTSGSETILLVEDESVVRGIVKLSLEAYGYTVLEAGSGQDAVALAEQHEGTINLVISDVIMPAMSGRELAEILRKRYQGLKVLFISGYTDDAVLRHGIFADEEEFLQKPFLPNALVTKVREVLDRAE